MDRHPLKESLREIRSSSVMDFRAGLGTAFYLQGTELLPVLAAIAFKGMGKVNAF
jgi:hypothetical protein